MHICHLHNLNSYSHCMCLKDNGYISFSQFRDLFIILIRMVFLGTNYAHFERHNLIPRIN